MSTLSHRNAVAAATAAAAKIAPTWPLDQLIAVNPWWELREAPLAEVSARLGALNQVGCVMPRTWFRARWKKEIQSRHLQAALADCDDALSERDLLDWLTSDDQLAHWHNFSDHVDSIRNLDRQMSWHDEIVHQVSQFCASYFSEDTPIPVVEDRGLYCAWLEAVRHDRGIEIVMGEKGLAERFNALPDDFQVLLADAAREMTLEESMIPDYFHALLLDINGWASWVAYRRWQAGLQQREEDLGPELVAIRLAWELVLWRTSSERNVERASRIQHHWQVQFERLPSLLQQHETAQRPAWVWQRAAELSFQEACNTMLLSPVPQSVVPVQKKLQAVFCIDVRSEVYRRALEMQDASIQTLGFAGFFGLPIAYSPAGSTYERPQLPGLLAPSVTATESAPIGTTKNRSQFNRAARWAAFGRKAPAAFGFVESAGIAYAFKLLRESLLGADADHPVNNACLKDATFTLHAEGKALDVSAQSELAAGILNAMTLTGDFASVVLLVGHGSSTRNNPHAAGLDCGACGGQTGEINVRVLAQVLNTPAVRKSLADDHGISIAEDTRFVPALHDTTTDDVHCLTDLPTGASQVAKWLEVAGKLARHERAPRLGVPTASSDRDIRARSRDWSQVRPEWGLAGNACFVVAPRARIRHLNFDGRSFLHDYDWRGDAERNYAVLELIMTAPMIVTHWINMQYNASVTDNLRYGSGNKVLHNVVGGNLGVFEGNGGDLRIGLSRQSLHDGNDWVHAPLRLSVYLAAPAEAIADIAERHEVVRQLIDNDWLYLFQLDDDAGEIRRLYKGRWSVAASVDGTLAA